MKRSMLYQRQHPSLPPSHEVATAAVVPVTRQRTILAREPSTSPVCALSPSTHIGRVALTSATINHADYLDVRGSSRSRSQRSSSMGEKGVEDRMEKGQAEMSCRELIQNEACGCVRSDYFKPVNRSTLIVLAVCYAAMCLPPLVLISQEPWQVHHITCVNDTVQATMVGYDHGYVLLARGYSSNPHGDTGPDEFIWEWSDSEPWSTFDDTSGTSFGHGTKLLRSVKELLDVCFAGVLIVAAILLAALWFKTRLSRVSLQTAAAAGMLCNGVLQAVVSNISNASQVTFPSSWESVYPLCAVESVVTIQRQWLSVSYFTSILLFFPLLLLLGACNECRWCVDATVT